MVENSIETNNDPAIKLFSKGKGRPAGSKNKKKTNISQNNIEEIDVFVEKIIQENQSLKSEIENYNLKLKKYIETLNNIRTGNNIYRTPYSQISIGGKNGAIDELLKLFPNLK